MVSGEILPQVLEEANLSLYTSRLPQLTLVLLNLDNPEVPFFQDAAVRRALMLGLNRQRMVDSALDGQAIVADGPILPGTWAYFENIQHMDYDPETALGAIKDAGYTIPLEGGGVRQKDGVAFSFELAYPGDAVHTELVEAIRQDWGRLGVEVKPQPVTYGELLSNYLEQRTFQAVLVDLNLMRSPDPDPYPFWHQAMATGGQNYSKWNDRQASEYLERARTTTDFTERLKAYRNFQVRFTQEMPALPLYFPVYSYAVDAQVLGVSVGPLFEPSDRLALLPHWYLQETTAPPQPTAAAAVTP
jgi:peptide/nickel transport system substrate-binding protein